MILFNLQIKVKFSFKSKLENFEIVIYCHFRLFFEFRLRKWSPTTKRLVWKWLQLAVCKKMDNPWIHIKTKNGFLTKKFSNSPIFSELEKIWFEKISCEPLISRPGKSEFSARTNRVDQANTFWWYLFKYDLYQRVHKHTSVHYVFPPLTLIIRLNSEIKNRHNFFVSAFFSSSKTWNRFSESWWLRGYQKFCTIPWEFDLRILGQKLKLRGWGSNAKMWIFHFQFPGNRFEFGIISSNLGSSTIWAKQIQV